MKSWLPPNTALSPVMSAIHQNPLPHLPRRIPPMRGMKEIRGDRLLTERGENSAGESSFVQRNECFKSRFENGKESRWIHWTRELRRMECIAYIRASSVKIVHRTQSIDTIASRVFSTPSIGPCSVCAGLSANIWQCIVRECTNVS